MEVAKNFHLKKYAYIDALRGIAVLGVIAVHCSLYGNIKYNDFLPSAIKALISQGGRGVQLFYIASALTIFLSYSQRQNVEQHYKRNFFIRRLFRVAPLFYLAVTYYYFQWYCYNPQNVSISKLNVISNILFLHGISPYWINSLVPGGWSISIEMCFYCLIPYLFKKITNLSQALYFLYIVLIANIVFYVFCNIAYTKLLIDKQVWTDFMTLNIFNQLPIFALGIIMFFVTKQNYKFGLSAIHKTAVVLMLLTIIIQTLVLKNVKFPIHYFFIAGLFLLLFSLYLSKKPLSIFVNFFFKYLGKISFSLYLCHNAVLFWIERLGYADLFKVSDSRGAVYNYGARFIITVLFSAIFSTVTFYIIEQPFQKMGKKFINRLSI